MGLILMPKLVYTKRPDTVILLHRLTKLPAGLVAPLTGQSEAPCQRTPSLPRGGSLVMAFIVIMLQTTLHRCAKPTERLPFPDTRAGTRDDVVR